MTFLSCCFFLKPFTIILEIGKGEEKLTMKVFSILLTSWWGL